MPCYLLASGICQRDCLTEIWGRAGERVPPLVTGDVLTLEIEGIRTVRNRVVDPGPYPPIPPIPQARKGQPRGPRNYARPEAGPHAVP